jgi:hypothetical protein
VAAVSAVAATAAAVPGTNPVAAVAAHANIKAAAAVAVAAVAADAAKANNAPPKAAGTVSALAAAVAVAAAAPAVVVAVVKPSDSLRQNHGGLYGPPFLGRFPAVENFRGNGPPNLTTFAHELLFIFSPIHFFPHRLHVRHAVVARAAREIPARDS